MQDKGICPCLRCPMCAAGHAKGGMRMYEIMLDLEGKGNKNLYEQIYEFIKKEIQSGNLKCRERLPSTRKLAGQLSVSRSTAQLAYEQLLSE